MTGLVEDFQEKLDPECLVLGKLRKEGCTVSLKNAPETRVIVDFDKPGSPLGPGESRCDYLFIAEGDGGPGWVAPIELKRGRLEADEVLPQLRAGTSAAETLVRQGESIKFRPVAVARGISKDQRNKLKSQNAKIRFHGHEEEVRFLTCRAPLMNALGR